MKYIFLLFCFVLDSYNVPAQKTVHLPWNPRAIVIDNEDNLLIEMEDMIMQIKPDGTYSYITENMAKDFRGSVRPYCNMMVSDAAGNIYMSRKSDNEIWKMSKEGKFSMYAAEEQRQSNWSPPAAHIMDPGHIDFMAMDKQGNLYYAENVPDEVRINKLNTYRFYKLTSKGERTSFKNTDGSDLLLNQVDGIGIDAEGNLFVSNVKERCIKKITPDGVVTVVAGQCGKRDYCPVYTQGDVKTAELVQPGPIVFNKKGELFFADIRMNRIIKVANNKVTTVAGSSVIQPCGSNIAGRSKEGYKDGKALTALFNFPELVQLAIDSKDNIYILDGGNHAIRKLSADGNVTTVALRK